MSLMPVAPRSIGGVLDDALRLYRRSLLPSLPIALVAVLLTAVPTFLVTSYTQDLVGDPEAALALVQSPKVWGVYLLLILASVVMYGGLIARIDAIARGTPMSFGAAIGTALTRAPAVILASILFGLMICIGFVLLFIPGIYLWGAFQLVFVPLIVERAGVFESFGISRRLTRGNWWRASTIIFVALIILYVIMLMFGIIAGVVAAFSAGTAAVTQMSTGYLVQQQLISSVLSLFTMSFVPCILLSVYYDLKLRNEGSDLADRVGALNSG